MLSRAMCLKTISYSFSVREVGGVSSGGSRLWWSVLGERETKNAISLYPNKIFTFQSFCWSKNSAVTIWDITAALLTTWLFSFQLTCPILCQVQ